MEIFTEAEESLVSYLAGWLASKCGICAKCQDVLSKHLVNTWMITHTVIGRQISLLSANALLVLLV